MTFLHAHHHHEDEFCFPFYRKAKNPPSEISQFESDHKELIELMSEVEKMTSPEVEALDRPLLVEKLEKLKKELEPHLDLEVKVITPDFLKSNFDEKTIKAVDESIKAEAMKGDGTLILPLMFYNLSQDLVESWWNVEFPFVLRYIVMPVFLARWHGGYWKYATLAARELPNNHYATLHLEKAYNPEQAPDQIKSTALAKVISLARHVERLHIQNMVVAGSFGNTLSMLAHGNGALRRLKELRLKEGTFEARADLAPCTKDLQPGGYLEQITFLGLELMRIDSLSGRKLLALIFPNLTGLSIVKNNDNSTQLSAERIRQFIFAHPELKVLFCPNVYDYKSVETIRKLQDLKLVAYHDMCQSFDLQTAINFVTESGVANTIESLKLTAATRFDLATFLTYLPKIRELSILGHMTPSVLVTNLPPLRALEISGGSASIIDSVLNTLAASLEILLLPSGIEVRPSNWSKLRIFKGRLHSTLEELLIFINQSPQLEQLLLLNSLKGDCVRAMAGWKRLQRVSFTMESYSPSVITEEDLVTFLDSGNVRFEMHWAEYLDGYSGIKQDAFDRLCVKYGERLSPTPLPRAHPLHEGWSMTNFPGRH
ncbi:hypothetical protein HDU97_008939 [Phlyctochytrium planicorne]|nr:hypothetical protein HDU97_008939 [Phlyctochytrium planicorne]